MWVKGEGSVDLAALWWGGGGLASCGGGWLPSGEVGLWGGLMPCGGLAALWGWELAPCEGIAVLLGGEAGCPMVPLRHLVS